MESLEGMRENNERIPNFLDEKLEITFSITEEAMEHLPEITAEELKTRQERFRVLLGNFSIQGDKANIVVRGVMEITPDESVHYVEGKEEITNIDMNKIKRSVADLQKNHAEYKDFGHIGDMHTHPVLPHEAPGKPWYPSEIDIQSIIELYDNGTLTSDKPYIFSIAGLDSEKKTHYSFCYLVRRGDQWIVRGL